VPELSVLALAGGAAIVFFPLAVTAKRPLPVRPIYIANETKIQIVSMRRGIQLFILMLPLVLAAAVKAQNIYVANGGNGAIGEYGPNGSVINASLISGLNEPEEMAISGSDLFVPNYTQRINGDGTVGEYTTSGATVNASLVSGLDGPTAAGVSGSDLFVGNIFGTVGEYTTSGATVNSSLFSPGANIYGFAFSGSDVFVVCEAAGSVGEYTTSGATVKSSLISGLSAPWGIAISGNDLFVANYNTGSVGEYTTSGSAVNASLITGLNDPEQIAVSGSDLYVVNNGNGTVGEYTTSGTTVNASLISGLNSPTGIVIGPVPEPGAAALLAVGAAAYLAGRSRRQRLAPRRWGAKSGNGGDMSASTELEIVLGPIAAKMPLLRR